MKPNDVTYLRILNGKEDEASRIIGKKWFRPELSFEFELPVVSNCNHVHLLFKLFNLIIVTITGIRNGT